LFVQSETGSGKNLAYLLHIQKLKNTPKDFIKLGNIHLRSTFKENLVHSLERGNEHVRKLNYMCYNVILIHAY